MDGCCKSSYDVKFFDARCAYGTKDEPYPMEDRWHSCLNHEACSRLGSTQDRAYSLMSLSRIYMPIVEKEEIRSNGCSWKSSARLTTIQSLPGGATPLVTVFWPKTQVTLRIAVMLSGWNSKSTAELSKKIVEKRRFQKNGFGLAPLPTEASKYGYPSNEMAS